MLIRSTPIAILLVSVCGLSLIGLQLLQVFRIRRGLVVRVGMHLFTALVVVVFLVLTYKRFVTIR